MRAKPGMVDPGSERGETALLLVDLVNDYGFPGGAALRRQAARIVPRIVALRQRFRRAHLPVVYGNDNFGRWRSDFRQIVDHCLEVPAAARLLQPLLPAAEDYFVLKPRHSAFFATPLQLLLQHLGTRRLVIVGVAGDSCVLSTAADARIHGYEVHVPRDCIASASARRKQRALAQCRETLDIDTTPSAALILPRRPAAGRKERRAAGRVKNPA